MTPRVEVEIGELVLHGFDPWHRHAIADAVERELARLLTERGVPPGLADGGGADRIDGGSFTAGPGRPEVVGGGVAEAVYGGLRQ